MLFSDTCFIPKGTESVLSIFHTQRDPKLWPNPLKFDPDRFLPEETQKRHPYSWFPFSAGPRNCIGKSKTLFSCNNYLFSGLRYAMMSMKIVLSHVIRKYKVYCDYKRVEDIELQFEFTLVAAKGWLISLEPRKASK